MNKLKINSGLASILVLASLFAGWQTLLLVVLFILLFCEVNDTIKGMIVKVVSFFAAITLFSTLWSLITDLVPLVTGSFNEFIGIIEGYIDEPIDLSKVNAYLFDPVNSIINIADSVVQYLLVLIRFMFIISVLANKVMKDNFISKFVNKYIDKVIRFINGIELGKVDINHPDTPSAPVRPQMVSTANENSGISLGSIGGVNTSAHNGAVESNFGEKKEEGVKPAMNVPPQTPVNQDNKDENK